MDFDKFLASAEERTLLLEVEVGGMMADWGIDWESLGPPLVEPVVGGRASRDSQ